MQSDKVEQSATSNTGNRRYSSKLGTIRTSPFSPIKRSIDATFQTGRNLLNSRGSKLPVWPPSSNTSANERYDGSQENGVRGLGMSRQLSSRTAQSQADRQFAKFHMEQQKNNQRAAKQFIEMTLGEPLPSDDLHECLKDGIILCR
jgi:hypothetical protein